MVGRYVVKASDDLLDYLDEPARRGAAALRYDQPLQELGERAEGSQGYGVFVDGDLVRVFSACS